MSLMRRAQNIGVMLMMLAISLPALYAQPIAKPQMIAFAAPQSFWVNGSPTALKSGNVSGRKHPVEATSGFIKRHEPTSKLVSGTKGKDSITQAIEANRSVPWSIVLGLTLLTLLPALLLSITPMVRLLVVFHFLRQALGTQTAPSNQILMGLALMMTWFLMQPALQKVEQVAVAPYQAGTISGMEAMDRGLVPVKQYMLRYAREKDLEVFAAAGMGTQPQSREDLPIQVVVPAYILSELKAGFQIGAVLFLPFLLVDLVVASVTTSVGMMQLPPVVISTPLKILLFVMVDGWNLLAHELIRSF
jgi:flagellar biosynthesis protein FliP